MSIDSRGGLGYIATPWYIFVAPGGTLLLRRLHITSYRSKGKAGPALRKRKKRRSAVEPKIGHMKSDNRMGRNFLKGVEGDRINALLAGIGANLRKLLAIFWPALFDLAKIYVLNFRIHWQPKFRQAQLVA